MTEAMMQQERKPRKRSAQERGDATKEKILESATKEFSERGYDGVTLRDIELAAGVQRGLVKYHFGGKEDVWKAAADKIFEELNEYRRVREETARDLSPKERLAFRIRSFVRFSAMRPELNRLMIQEGKRDSWRLRHILDNSLRWRVLELNELASESFSLSAEDYRHWYYMYVGASALMFSMAPEARGLFGIDVTSPEVVDRHAHMVADFLMWRIEQAEIEEAKK